MTGELQRTILASQSAIEEFCWDFQQWLGTQATARQAFASELLLREALVNAVEHGCRGIDGAAVRCVIRGGRNRILISVCDPGPGFDWAARRDAEPEENALSGRGVLIFKTYAQRVRFNRAGNAVFLLMRLDGDNSGNTRQ